MVRIDNKIREVVNQIKQEEAKLANLANKIEDAAPQRFSSYLNKSYIAEIVLSIQALLHFLKI